jgi:hypothetical protein
MELMFDLIRSLRFLDNRRCFDGEVCWWWWWQSKNGRQRPGNLSQANEHERTKGPETKSSAIAPQDISAGGGEPAHMPLCTMEAPVQVESFSVQWVGWSVVMPVFSD